MLKIFERTPVLQDVMGNSRPALKNPPETTISGAFGILGKILHFTIIMKCFCKKLLILLFSRYALNWLSVAVKTFIKLQMTI